MISALCTSALVRAAPFAAPGNTGDQADTTGASASASFGRVSRSVETKDGRNDTHSRDSADKDGRKETVELQTQAGLSNPLALAGYVQTIEIDFGRYPWMFGVIAAEFVVLGFGLWWMISARSWLHMLAGFLAAAYGILTLTICIDFVSNGIG